MFENRPGYKNNLTAESCFHLHKIPEVSSPAKKLTAFLSLIKKKG